MEIFANYTNEDLETPRIRLITLPGGPTPPVKYEQGPPTLGGYQVHYAFLNPYSGRRNYYKFKVHPMEDPGWGIVLKLIERVILGHKLTSLAGLTSRDPNRLKPRHLKTEFLGLWNNIRRSKFALLALKEQKMTEYQESDRINGYEEKPNVFLREPGDSGRTDFFAGVSYSGKTYFLQQELNKIKGLKRGGEDEHVADRPMYERIFMMTTSPYAEPLKMIDKKVDIKIIPFFVPKIISLLKSINDTTKNKLPFLLVLDDCFADMKKGTFKKLILTLRNSNISTTVLSQYIKHAEPEVRNSFHNMYITKFKREAWAYILKSGYQSDVEEMLGIKASPDKLAQALIKHLGQDILHIDLRKDKITTIPRKF